MKRPLTLLLLILFGWLPLAHAQASLQTRTLVFTHVTVIDTLRGALNKDITVVISGNRTTFGVSLACSTQEQSLRLPLAVAAANVDKTIESHLALFIRNESEPLASYDEQKDSARSKKESSPIFSCSTQIPLKQLATLYRSQA